MTSSKSLINRRWREGGPRRNSSSDTTNVYSNSWSAPPWTCEREENSKYLRKSCHYHIKCTVATFLAVLMWRRPLNSAALTAATHKGLKWVSDGMGNQVGIQVINKCKIQMIRKDLYNMEELPWSGGQKKSEREYCSMLNNPNIVIYIYIYGLLERKILWS